MREHRATLTIREPRDTPGRAMKAPRTAVQLIAAFVRRQPVLYAVECEPRMRDPVRVPADERSEESTVTRVVIERVKSGRDVRDDAISVGNTDRYKSSAVGDEPHFHPARVGEREDVHRLRVPRMRTCRASRRRTPTRVSC